MTQDQLPSTIHWATSDFSLVLALNNDGVVYLRSFGLQGSQDEPPSAEIISQSGLPLNSLRLVGEGNTAVKTAKSLIGSRISARMQYQSHKTEYNSESRQNQLEITSADSVTGVQITNYFSAFDGSPVIRCSATIINQSDAPTTITQISTLTIGGLTNTSTTWYEDYSLMTATNGWFREVQWRDHQLPDIGIDTAGILELRDGHSGSQAIFSLSNRSSFSTGSFLPMGLLKRKDARETWFWQVEHNGSWRWEIGDYHDAVYLSLGGPTAADHEWRLCLDPGQSFTTVHVAFGRIYSGFECAFHALNDYRRKMRRPHPDIERMPIIFNDYMNCLMGDPDEDKIKGLLAAVANSGAEYFVIDAGWYADDSNWWDDVGLWEPSKKRFPSGFKILMDEIRATRLTPGLWIEPEVVGTRSVVAQGLLPETAFFHEQGQRIIERGRFQLDYRQPQVIEWMNKIIESLVVEYGVGYFKFDYNIEVLNGTDEGTQSRGANQLQHQRAYVDWVCSLLDRYPGLVIENCSSGGQRMDYSMLSVHPIQSTSDQQDPVLYAAISAALPTAVTPEQSASWVYPQPIWDDETNALTVVNGLLGRVLLSGRLDILKPHQLELVYEGMRVYNNIKPHIITSQPFWPLGLPKWHDKWVSLGLMSQSGQIAFVSIWRRGGITTEIDLPLPNTFQRSTVQVRLLYPAGFEADLEWNAVEGKLRVRLPHRICARLISIEIIE